MTKRVTSLVPGRQYRPGAGVMIFVMERVPCILVVSADLFQLTRLARLRVRLEPRFRENARTPYHVITEPIFGLLIVLCHHMLICTLGLALGGVWGVREGAKRPLAVSNTRLRINSVLNSVTRRGTFIGNSAGVIGSSYLPSDRSMLNSFCLFSPFVQRHQFVHRCHAGKT